MGAGSSSGTRKFHAKHCSSPLGTLDPDCTPICGADRFDDGETKACTTQLPRPCFVHSIESIKNLRQGFFRNTDPSISNLKDCFPIHRKCGHGNSASGHRVLNRVVHEVNHDLFQTNSIALYLHWLMRNKS